MKETQPFMKYTVHPVAAMLPLLDAEEFKLLKEDLKENGQLDDIIMQGDVLIDGRNRMTALEDLGIKPKISEFSGTEEQIVAFIISKNFHRRHLTEDQRVAFIAKVRGPAIIAEAKKDMPGKSKATKLGKGESRDRLAAEAKTSKHKAEQALSVVKTEPPPRDPSEPPSLPGQPDPVKPIDEVIAGKKTLKEAAKAAKAKKKANTPPKPAKAEKSLLEQVGKQVARVVAGYPVSVQSQVRKIIVQLCGGKHSERDTINALEIELAKERAANGPSRKELAAKAKENKALANKAIKEGLAGAKDKREANKAAKKAPVKAKKAPPKKKPAKDDAPPND